MFPTRSKEVLTNRNVLVSLIGGMITTQPLHFLVIRYIFKSHAPIQNIDNLWMKIYIMVYGFWSIDVVFIFSSLL